MTRDKSIIIKTIQSGEKYQGHTNFYISMYCLRCAKKYVVEYFGILPSKNISDICAYCIKEIKEDGEYS